MKTVTRVQLSVVWFVVMFVLLIFYQVMKSMWITQISTVQIANEPTMIYSFTNIVINKKAIDGIGFFIFIGGFICIWISPFLESFKIDKE